MSTLNTDNDKKVTTQTFWDAAYPMIAVTEKHPFLVSMVDGTLDEENFKYYVVQDTLYLRHYADCLRRVAAKAPTPEDAAQLEDYAKGAESCEMKLHDSFFKQWNIEAPPADAKNDPMQMMPNCLLYTSYMKKVVATESYAQGLAVLLPCFWVYMHVGHVMLKLRETLDASGDASSKSKRKPQYDAWIDMYAGDEFEKHVKDYLVMVNAECARIQSNETDKDSKEMLASMQQHFIMGCKLEHMFWDQAQTNMQWPNLGGL
jgi:thiaminase/transcriptional activator TenA